MKFIITESRYSNLVTNYLDIGVYPDYNWGPELHDFYREEIRTYGIYDFVINDNVAYTYFGEWDGYDYMYLLLIQPWLSRELTSMFGPKWKPIFKEWFEKNSGLEVRDMKVGENLGNYID
jgi:hypothetical protein